MERDINIFLFKDLLATAREDTESMDARSFFYFKMHILELCCGNFFLNDTSYHH